MLLKRSSATDEARIPREDGLVVDCHRHSRRRPRNCVLPSRVEIDIVRFAGSHPLAAAQACWVVFVDLRCFEAPFPRFGLNGTRATSFSRFTATL